MQKSSSKRLTATSTQWKTPKPIHKCSKKTIRTIKCSPSHNSSHNISTLKSTLKSSSYTHLDLSTSRHSDRFQHTLLPSNHQSRSHNLPCTLDHIPFHSAPNSTFKFTPPLSPPPSFRHPIQPSLPPQSTPLSHTIQSFLPSSAPLSSHPLYASKRTFLNSFFEKQRKISWTLHRRKKMEMSADMLSRPTFRPDRTESMDLIQKEIYEITLGANNMSSMADKILYNRQNPIQDDVPIPMKELFPRQRIFVYYLKLQENAQFAIPVYLSLWFVSFFAAYFNIKTNPFEYRRKFMDLLDISAFQTMHQVVDSNPSITDALLAFGVTSATDLLRIPLLFLCSSLYFNKNGIVMLTPEAYKLIRYRYEFEQRPEPEFDVSKIDPNLHHGIVSHPGSDPIPRNDYYGRDRQRDLIPKDRIDLEYVLHAWQRTNAVRHKREALIRRTRLQKQKIVGPRWAKTGIGIFKRF